MHLTCRKCQCEWDDEIPAGQAVAMCPECMEYIPLTKQQATPRPTPQVASAPQAAPARQPQVAAANPPSQPQPAAKQTATQTVLNPSFQNITRPSAQPSAPASQTAASHTVQGRAAQTGTPSTVVKPIQTVPATPTGTIVQAQQKKEWADGATPAGGEVAVKTPPGAQSTSRARLEKMIGRTIDGYVIQKLLGAGGMGAVFQARQISLERDVAFKVLAPKLAGNADFLARFTREALSAAQLNHHNIVQVYDVGSEGDLHYITMEFVRGQSLAQMIKKDGRLQMDDASAYTLQAARGLKYAHDQGIVHRDIKPDNLMLNEHGIVKIADMGLAKRIGAAEKKVEGKSPQDLDGHESLDDMNFTHADAAMGTPAYMAPEQALDAAKVGAQADQYSLGCTLYYLCAGRTPHSGTTAFELMSKHLNEPITPLDVHIHGVPPALSTILNKMLEKDPAKRFKDMGEVVRVLESYLGVDSSKGPYTPREHHLAVLEEAQRDYYAAPSAKKRRLVQTAFLTVVPLLALFALFTGGFAMAGGLVGLFVLTPLAHFVLNGLRTKNYLFRRVRAVFFGMPMMSWVKTIAGALIGLAALLVLGWLPWWLGFAAIAAGLAFAYRKFVVMPLAEERAPAVEKMHAVLKELRVRGVAEDALHDFVCRFSGEHWEEFFEEFFDYESMILARGKWARADKVKPRKRFAVWREPVARWLESIEEARQEAKNRKALAKAESRRLREMGIDEKKAEAEGKLAATKIMNEGFKAAAELKERREQKIDHYYEGVGKGKSHAGRRIFTAVRAALATVMIIAAAAKMFGLPMASTFSGIFEGLGYYGMGQGGTLWGLIVGALLMSTVFMGAIMPAVLMTVAALLMVFTNTLVGIANQPMLTAGTVFWFACALAALGVVMIVMRPGKQR